MNWNRRLAIGATAVVLLWVCSAIIIVGGMLLVVTHLMSGEFGLREGLIVVMAALSLWAAIRMTRRLRAFIASHGRT